MSTGDDRLLEFVRDYAGTGYPLTDDVHLCDACGIEGDDAVEFIERFGEQFAVDLSGYKWFFHHGGEGWNPGGLFFASPDRRASRIPITMAVLREAVEQRRWPLEYPAHDLPSERWDLFLNDALLVVFVLTVCWFVFI